MTMTTKEVRKTDLASMTSLQMNILELKTSEVPRVSGFHIFGHSVCRTLKNVRHTVRLEYWGKIPGDLTVQGFMVFSVPV